MPEYEVSRHAGSDLQAEFDSAEEQGYDEGTVIEAKEYAVGVLSEILGIDSEPDAWHFNTHPHGWTWLSTQLNGMTLWVYNTSDHRRNRVYAWPASDGSGGEPMRRIRSLEDLNAALERDRYNKEHPYVPGPYDNMGG